MSLHEGAVRDIPQLGVHENEVFNTPFTEKEVYCEDITQMKYDKAPGLDGFLAEFYQNRWEIIKENLMPMFKDVFNGQLQFF